MALQSSQNKCIVDDDSFEYPHHLFLLSNKEEKIRKFHENLTSEMNMDKLISANVSSDLSEHF